MRVDRPRNTISVCSIAAASGVGPPMISSAKPAGSLRGSARALSQRKLHDAVQILDRPEVDGACRSVEIAALVGNNSVPVRYVQRLAGLCVEPGDAEQHREKCTAECFHAGSLDRAPWAPGFGLQAPGAAG